MVNWLENKNYRFIFYVSVYLTSSEKSNLCVSEHRRDKSQHNEIIICTEIVNARVKQVNKEYIYR